MQFKVTNENGDVLNIGVSTAEVQRLEAEVAKLKRQHEKFVDDITVFIQRRHQLLRKYISLLEEKLTSTEIAGIRAGDVAMQIAVEGDDARDLREWLV